MTEDFLNALYRDTALKGNRGEAVAELMRGALQSCLFSIPFIENVKARASERRLAVIVGEDEGVRASVRNLQKLFLQG